MIPSRFLPLLLCWLLPATLVATEEATCNRDEDCQEGLDCALGYCVAKDCIAKELKDAGALFDPKEYRHRLFQEAGVNEMDLFRGWLVNRDPYSFVQTVPVQAIKRTIQAHAQELVGIAQIMRYCSSGEIEKAHVTENLKELELDNKDDKSQDGTRRRDQEIHGSGLGQRVGSLFSAVTNFFTGRGAPQEAETGTAMSPTPAPSESPTFLVEPKIYVGFHVEGGLLMDASLSYFFAADNSTSEEGANYLRQCFGAEFGSGGEVALIAVFANLREFDDIVGVSLLGEFTDVGLGVHFGAGVGCFTEGEGTQNGNQQLHYEITVGAGLGFSIFGAAVCRTSSVGPTPVPTLPPVTQPPVTLPPATVGPVTPAPAAPTSSTSVTVPSTMDYGFFDVITPRAPTPEEIAGLMVQKTRFYSDLFSAAYPNLVSVTTTFIGTTFTAGIGTPVRIDFDATAMFASGTTIPSEGELFAVMEGFDVEDFIQNYVWASEPVNTTIFYQTVLAVYNARIPGDFVFQFAGVNVDSNIQDICSAESSAAVACVIFACPNFLDVCAGVDTPSQLPTPSSCQGLEDAFCDQFPGTSFQDSCCLTNCINQVLAVGACAVQYYTAVDVSSCIAVPSSCPA